MTMLTTNFHVEMNPSDVGTKDKHIVQEVIKEMAKARPIGLDGQKGFKGAAVLPILGPCSPLIP